MALPGIARLDAASSPRRLSQLVIDLNIEHHLAVLFHKQSDGRRILSGVKSHFTFLTNSICQ